MNNYNQLQQLQKKVNRNKEIYWLSIILILLLTIGNVWQYFNFTKNIKSGLEQHYQTYRYIDPGLVLIDEKDITSNFEPLRQKIDEIVNPLRETFDVSLYFEFMNNGGNIVVNKDLSIWPVSLAKLPLAMVVAKKAERGLIDLADKVELIPDDFDAKAGHVWENYMPGDSLRYDKLIEYSISQSDNTAYRALLRLTSEEERQELVEELGLTQLFNEGQSVSAKQYSRILRALYSASYLNREESDDFIKFMVDTTFPGYIRNGIPAEVLVAHKYGKQVVLNVYSDAGIVYVPGRPYILTIMVQSKTGVGEEKAAELISLLSSEIYTYVSTFENKLK